MRWLHLLALLAAFVLWVGSCILLGYSVTEALPVGWPSWLTTTLGWAVGIAAYFISAGAFETEPHSAKGARHG